MSSRERVSRRLFFGVVILAIGALLPYPSAAAQSWDNVADSVFQHPVSDTVLPNSPVLAIAQDETGFLWVGTEGGVVRWDGYHYHVYQADRANPTGLPDNYIQSLFVDARGTLWIATLSGGLARYDRLRDRFVSYRPSPEGLSSVAVRAIADDGSGGVWAATNQGLDEVSADRGVIRHLRHDRDPASLPDDNIRAVFRDSKGRLWIGTVGAVVRQDRVDGPLVKMILPARENQQPVADAFAQDVGGTIWIGTDDGAYIIRPGSESAGPVRIPSPKRSDPICLGRQTWGGVARHLRARHPHRQRSQLPNTPHSSRSAASAKPG